MEREKLSKYLRPKHPKIVKLDADIERAGQLQEIYQRQNGDQLTAARQANQMKTDNVMASVKEWEAKVVAANAIIGEANRLKLNVERPKACMTGSRCWFKTWASVATLIKRALPFWNPPRRKTLFFQRKGRAGAGHFGRLGGRLGHRFPDRGS